MSIKVQAGPKGIELLDKLFKELCPNVRITAKGDLEIIDPKAAMDSPGCKCMKFHISNDKNTTTIHPTFSPDVQVPGAADGVTTCPSQTLPGKGAKLGPPNAAGGASPAGAGASSDVYIDLSDNDGKGYYCFDKQGNPISSPLFIVLFHELCSGHASRAARGVMAREHDAEEAAVGECENEFRASLKDGGGAAKYSLRGGGSGGPVGAPGSDITTRQPDKRS